MKGAVDPERIHIQWLWRYLNIRVSNTLQYKMSN
jgi:hypothetical protein